MRLGLYGIGLDLPPTRDARELVTQAGGDPSIYEGWRNIRVAAEDDQPSDMAARALQRALDDAGMPASSLRFVLSTGVSRDYVPSWSLATETMRRVGASTSCVGIDLTIGCLGVLTGLHMALGWLMADGGGFGAIVSAEKWTQTIDRRDVSTKPLWGHSDGASAVLVGIDPARPRLRFGGAVFASHADNNGLVLIKYGGTRFPVPLDGEPAHTRRVKPIAPSQVWEDYRAGFSEMIAAFRARFEVTPVHVVCNQISPKLLSMIAEVVGVSRDQVYETGHANGHVGSSDTLIGLRHLLDDTCTSPIIAIGSTPFAFGGGLLIPDEVDTGR